MLAFELSAISRTIVEDMAEVEPDEEVLVVTDAEMMDVATPLAVAARAAGGQTVLSVMPRAEAHGNEPPATIAEAMKAADIVFAVTTKALTHSDARQASAKVGTRTYILRGVTTEMMLEGGINTDYEELTRITTAVSTVLREATTAHVTSEAGTDVTMDLNGRGSYVLDGRFYDDGRAAAAIPTGEAPTSPAEGTTNGTVVIDASMDNIGQLENPIVLTITDGVVSAVSGGAEADELRHILENADENAGNIAEFAIGTNPDARFIGNLAEDKKVQGSVHFAVGDNRGIGGSVQSNIHLDGVLAYPTVDIDGVTIVRDGVLDTELVFERAAEVEGR